MSHLNFYIQKCIFLNAQSFQSFHYNQHGPSPTIHAQLWGVGPLRGGVPIRVVEPERPSEGVPVFGDEAGKLDDSSKALRMQCRKLVLTVVCFLFHHAHAIFVSVDAIMPLFSQAWGLIRDGKATVVHESVQDYVYETYKGK